jgi:hypothetical protein
MILPRISFEEVYQITLSGTASNDITKKYNSGTISNNITRNYNSYSKVYHIFCCEKCDFEYVIISSVLDVKTVMN